MEENVVVDMLKEAIIAADDHIKVAGEKLYDENQEQLLLRQTPAFGLTAFCTALVLIITLIAIARVLGRSFFSKYLPKTETCFRSAYAKLLEILLTHWNHNINEETPSNEPRQPEPPQPDPQPIEPPQPEPKEINKEYVKNEIKASIEDFRSMKERLKIMKSQKINTKDVKDMKAAIKMVRSIEENLKEMKSQNLNVEEVKEMEIAIQPAIKAVESIEKIINKGAWLLGQF